MHEVLGNRLRGLSLPRKSVVRLTDRPDMTLDVFHGRKTTIQQQQSIHLNCSFTQTGRSLIMQGDYFSLNLSSGPAVTQISKTDQNAQLQCLTCLTLANLYDIYSEPVHV